MMLSLYILISALVLGGILYVLSFVLKLKKDILPFKAREEQTNNNSFRLISKILAFIVFGLFLFRIYHTEVFEQIVNRDGLFSPDYIVQLVIFRAMLAGSIFLICLTPWFNYRPFQDAIGVLGLISYLINIFNFKQNVQAMLGIVSVPSHTLREVMLAIELVVGLATCILYLIKRVKEIIEVKDFSKKNILTQAIVSPVIFITSSILVCNSYSFDNLFDIKEYFEYTNSFNKDHIIVILSMIFITLVCAIIFRNVKDKKYLHCFLAYGALVCLIDYLYARDYGNFVEWKLPLHLCNTGVFLMFISFTIKSKPIFYFNYLVNIVGALFAICMPDDDFYFFSQGGLHFWVNHILLFVLPITAVSGGFYERPKPKYVMYSTIVFILYFFLVAFLDAIWQDKVNFFFLNGDSIVDKFMWAVNIKSGHVVTFNIGSLNFRVYWLYWLLVFLFYLGFIAGAWFIFASLYVISDGYAELIIKTRNKQKEIKYLRKEMGDRTINEPLHPENKGKVIISHFSKIYNGETKKAVDDFNLEIKPGTVYGFLGHNGAGKSTTIKSLVGIQTITEGRIEINGYDLELQPLEAKMNIGYVSDNHTVYEHLTGREYINYVADLYLVSEEDRNERIDRMVKMFKLEDAIDREIKGYSHGMKQKIVVIGSLIHEPKVWVLDEPLTGLDPTSSYQIKQIMKDYASRGNIVFFSSHVIEVVEKICDEICIIGNGKLIGTWKINELEKQGLTLQDLYIKYVKYEGGNNNA